MENIKTEAPQNDFKLIPTPFLAISIKKLLIMSIGSFGFYFLYWFYANWVRQRNKTAENISPFWRTAFAIFFVHSLFSRVENSLQEINSDYKFKAIPWALLYWVIALSGIMCGIIPEYYDPNADLFNGIFSLVQTLVFVWIIIMVQKAMQLVNFSISEQVNNKYTLADWLLLVLGLVPWFGVCSMIFGLV